MACRDSESKAAKAVDMVDHAMRLKLYRKAWQKERDAILYYTKMKLSGYMEVDTLMQDPNIGDIFCTGHGGEVSVKHRRHAALKILHANIAFGNNAIVDTWIQTMAARYGKPMTADNPMAHRTTPENHKLMLIEDAIESSFVVRKYIWRPHTITDLLENSTLSVDMAAYLWFLLDARPFMLVTGETGSGKTTMLNALMDMTNPRKTAMVIENAREIQLVNPCVKYCQSGSEGIHDIPDKVQSLVSLSIEAKLNYLFVAGIQQTCFGLIGPPFLIWWETASNIRVILLNPRLCLWINTQIS